VSWGRALAVIMVASISGANGSRAQEPIPTVTLAEALRRGTQLDPNYVGAVGQVDNAEWGRRAARLAFVVPSLTAQLDATKYSAEFFNLGTLQPQ